VDERRGSSMQGRSVPRREGGNATVRGPRSARPPPGCFRSPRPRRPARVPSEMAWRGPGGDRPQRGCLCVRGGESRQRAVARHERRRLQRVRSLVNPDKLRHLGPVLDLLGDPLQDIRRLEDVAWVMKGGVVVKDRPPGERHSVCDQSRGFRPASCERLVWRRGLRAVPGFLGSISGAGLGRGGSRVRRA